MEFLCIAHDLSNAISSMVLPRIWAWSIEIFEITVFSLTCCNLSYRPPSPVSKIAISTFFH